MDNVLYSEARAVAMQDTDAAGVIYFAAPLTWHESALMGWLRSIGHPISQSLASGYAFPCVHVEADYALPLRVDDPIVIRLHASKVGKSSFGLTSKIYRADLAAVTVRAAYVWASNNQNVGAFASAALPNWLRAALGGA